MVFALAFAIGRSRVDQSVIALPWAGAKIALTIAAQRFAGGPNPEGRGFIPNITQIGAEGLVREG